MADFHMCYRTVDLPIPYVASDVGECYFCGASVWFDPISRPRHAYLICSRCLQAGKLLRQRPG